MIEPTEDELRRRLRAANPVSSTRTLLPSGRSLADLLEVTMSTDLSEPRVKPRSWRIGALAAAVAAILVAAGVYLAVRPHRAQTAIHQTPKTVLTLSLPKPPSGPSLGTCVQVNVATLAPMQVAFSGTVTSTSGGAVTMTVDHWYRGGNADEVRLATPNPSVPTTAEGTVELLERHRYLVTATDGVVTTCGFTSEWSADTAALFETAFGK